MTVVVAVPVKSFTAAKVRLETVLDPTRRSAVGRALAERTLDVVLEAGAEPLVVAGDPEVTAWAGHRGAATIASPPGLDAAAISAVRWSGQRPWAILHADLPLLTVTELVEALELLATGRPVIAPSSDGGTSLLAGAAVFSYGPGSFHRHLAALRRADPFVVVRTGLLLDLDGPDDLASARRHPRGRWLDAVCA